MERNYFKTLAEAIKFSIDNIETPISISSKNNGENWEAINQKGEKIWRIDFINEIMGWQIGAYPHFLSINNPLPTKQD